MVRRVKNKKVLRIMRSRKLWLGVGSVLIAVVAVQLLFPHDRSLIGVRLDDLDVSLKTKAELSELVTTRYKSANVVVKNPELKTPFREAGIAVDTSATVDAVVAYPFWQRLIPFSSVYRAATGAHTTQLSYKPMLREWAETVVTACKKEPVNAVVASNEQGELAVSQSIDGRRCQAETVVAQTKKTTPQPRLEVDVRPATVLPARRTEAVKKMLAQIETTIAKGVAVSVLDTTTTAKRDEIVSWLTFPENDKKQFTIDVDPAKMVDFINRAQQPVYQAPRPTIITMLDGRETGRVAGVDGRGIDGQKVVDGVRAILRTQKNTPVVTEPVTLKPPEEVKRSYTNTAVGLQALLNDLAAEKGDMAIAVMEVGGQGRSLSVNGSKSYHPASTYKLMLAYSVIKRIETGQIKWNDQIDGKTIDACLTDMIVDSENMYTQALGEKIGWNAVHADAQSIGMMSTDLRATSFATTALDQALFLKKLQQGQLMKSENRDKLLELMKRQRYRSGIPTGASVSVADKVGFMGGLLHDSAIVYSAQGAYALTVYSNGASWGDIADVARRINALIG